MHCGARPGRIHQALVDIQPILSFRVEIGKHGSRSYTRRRDWVIDDSLLMAGTTCLFPSDFPTPAAKASLILRVYYP